MKFQNLAYIIESGGILVMNDGMTIKDSVKYVSSTTSDDLEKTLGGGVYNAGTFNMYGGMVDDCW